MAIRTRRLLDIGTGPRAKKAVDLAIKHPKTEVVAIDMRADVAYAKYLKSLGLKSKPKNLDIKKNAHALNYLRKQRANSFDFMSSHFVLQHQTREGRRLILSQVMRTLRPGGRFFALTEHSFFGQEVFEMRQLGFKVEVKPISIKDVGKLGTDHARENAHGNETTKGAFELNEIIQAEAKKRKIPVEEIQKAYLDFSKQFNEKYIREREPNAITPEQKDSIKRMLRDERLRFTKHRFVIVTAIKPRVRYVGNTGAKSTSYSIDKASEK